MRRTGREAVSDSDSQANMLVIIDATSFLRRDENSIDTFAFCQSLKSRKQRNVCYSGRRSRDCTDRPRSSPDIVPGEIPNNPECSWPSPGIKALIACEGGRGGRGSVIAVI